MQNKPHKFPNKGTKGHITKLIFSTKAQSANVVYDLQPYNCFLPLEVFVFATRLLTALIPPQIKLSISATWILAKNVVMCWLKTKYCSLSRQNRHTYPRMHQNFKIFRFVFCFRHLNEPTRTCAPSDHLKHNLHVSVILEKLFKCPQLFKIWVEHVGGLTRWPNPGSAHDVNAPKGVCLVFLFCRCSKNSPFIINPASRTKSLSSLCHCVRCTSQWDHICCSEESANLLPLGPSDAWVFRQKNRNLIIQISVEARWNRQPEHCQKCEQAMSPWFPASPKELQFSLGIGGLWKLGAILKCRTFWVPYSAENNWWRMLFSADADPVCILDKKRQKVSPLRNATKLRVSCRAQVPPGELWAKHSCTTLKARKFLDRQAEWWRRWKRETHILSPVQPDTDFIEKQTRAFAIRNVETQSSGGYFRKLNRWQQTCPTVPNSHLTTNTIGPWNFSENCCFCYKCKTLVGK